MFAALVFIPACRLSLERGRRWLSGQGVRQVRLARLRLSPDETWLLAGVSRSWLLDVGQPGRLDLGATVAWKFWSPEGIKLIGAARGKSWTLRDQDTRRVA
jgi:hypothetical protein